MRTPPTSTAIAAFLACTALGACQHVNEYSASATTYNVEAEKTLDTALVLNIVRASKRRPLVFSDLQTIAGSNPASGSLAFSIPLAQNGGSTASTASPTLTVGSGPTVTAGIINTQEFYQGILKPIPMETADLLVHRGFGRDLIFTLLFSEITITQTSWAGDKKFTFSATVRNDPLQDVWSLPGNLKQEDVPALDRFQRLVETLVAAGLSTQATKATADPVGPILLDSDINDSELVGKITKDGLSLKSVSWCGFDADDIAALRARRGFPEISLGDAKSISKLCDRIKEARARDSQSDELPALLQGLREALSSRGWPIDYYQLVKKNDDAGAEFCLEQTGVADTIHLPACDDANSVAQGARRAGPASSVVLSVRTPEQRSNAPDLPAAALAINARRSGIEKEFCDIAQYKSEIKCDTTNKDVKYAVSFTPRSIYDIMYYLGELQRRTETSTPYPLVFVAPASDQRFAAGSIPICAHPQPMSGCQVLFALDEGDQGRSGFVAVDYDGVRYSIPEADSRKAANGEGPTDKTYEVLDLVTELLALSRNAKDLPTSSVFTLRGP